MDKREKEISGREQQLNLREQSIKQLADVVNADKSASEKLMAESEDAARKLVSREKMLAEKEKSLEKVLSDVGQIKKITRIMIQTGGGIRTFESAKKHHATLLSVINVRGSSAERESVHVIPVNAGPEKAVASTKAATTQLTMLTLLAYAISGKQKQGEKLLLKASKLKEILLPSLMDPRH